MKPTWFLVSVFSLCLVYLASAEIGDISQNGKYVEPEAFKTYSSSCKALNPKKSGVQKIQVGKEVMEVYCDSTIAGKGWMTIQRRVSPEVNFFRNWTTYVSGFGDLKGNFFIGLEKLNNITILQPQELYIHLEDFNGTTAYAYYNLVTVASKYSNYSLMELGAYTGTAGDSLRYHRGMPFSTFDRDNDNSTANCAAKYTGAWWYNDCMGSNLNGAYLAGNHTDTDLYGKGINWGLWRGFYYSYKTVNIMLRSLI
ncbi:hypothetical protein KR009_009615 [Drosophila setifemur]|nr:hypothetical protein KR009_009615 [Drosophila setifemur]